MAPNCAITNKEPIAELYQVHKGDPPSTPRSQRYWFDFEAKTNRLVGVVEPQASTHALPDAEDESLPDSPAAPPPPPITLRSLHEHLEDEGYADYYYLKNAVELFLKKIQRFETGRYPLAEKRDAKINISISHDKTTARIQTDRAYGGKPLNAEWIAAEMAKAKIAEETIDSEKLETLLAAKDPVDLIIARAKPPEHGTAGRLEALIESKTLTSRDADSEDAIDQNEVFEFTVVAPGDPLMRRHPPTTGSDGLDVQGKVIRAKAGASIEFSKPFEGVELSPDDENLLVATEKGHPVFNKFGVKVDPLMALEAVDIHSGHVDYDGSVIIKNNVEPGLIVRVTGDVFVKGSIIKATVRAGGSITVSGGVNADDIDDEHSCHLEAQGDVSAKFFHHASVHCQGDLHAAEYIMQCRIVSEGYINVGQERGRGCIIGGHCSSNSGINAKVLGSEAYVTTMLMLGSDSELHQEVIRLTELLKRRIHEKDQLSSILEKVQSTTSPTNVGSITIDKERKIENTVQMLHVKIREIQQQLLALKSRIKISDQLAVRVSDRIFPNVMINICGHAWSCEETRRRCLIHLQEDRISFDNL